MVEVFLEFGEGEGVFVVLGEEFVVEDDVGGE